jgi:hypothetical protein
MVDFIPYSIRGSTRGNGILRKKCRKLIQTAANMLGRLTETCIKSAAYQRGTQIALIY